MPRVTNLWGIERAQLEALAFYEAWLLAFAHEASRGQCAAIAGLALLVPSLNWLTTGEHPLRALGRGTGVVAIMDPMMFVLAALAFAAARRLSREPAARVAMAPPVAALVTLSSMRRLMVEAGFAASAFAASYLGFAALALRQRPHHNAVAGSRRGVAPAPALLRRHLLLARLALLLSCLLSCLLSLASRGPSFGGVSFSFALSAGALGVMLTLSYRPHWLRPLQRATSAIQGLK